MESNPAAALPLIIPEAEAATKRLPGDLAIWFFILAELLVFGVFFLAYAFARVGDPALFNAGQATLSRSTGALNTVLLICGSWFVALAVQAAKCNRTALTSRHLALGMLCGAGFLVVKGREFAIKLGEGISLSTDTFYMFYLSLTYFHFLHVVLGMVILAVLWFNARQGRYHAADCHGLETGAAYWHMVDLVWIVLFPLVYVMR